MTIDRRLLSIIGRRFPAIYDVIPRGPQAIFVNRLSEAALNPQPLPPHELGAAIAREFIHAVWLVNRLGSDPSAIFADLDDWCPTLPKLPKLPPWWPPIPEPDPDPHPEWFTDFHLGFAAQIAVAATKLEGTRAGELLNKAIDRSLDSINSQT